MLGHHLTRGASEWCLASHHHPERYSKRVQIRADVHANSRELLRAGKFGCPGKCPRRRNPRFRSRFVQCLRKTEVDNFSRYTASLLQPDHDVRWLDISVD